MKSIAVLAILVCVPVAANAQVFCVRQGATGAGDGSDWTNAFPDLPTSMVRGATYYLASGSYAGHTFADPVSGASAITVKRATVADHGTSAGWSDSYASGEALFTGAFTFVTGYYTIDGQTGGGPGSWTSGFGIRIYPSYNGQPSAHQIYIEGPNFGAPPMPTHFVFRHLDIQGAGYHAPHQTNQLDGIAATTTAGVNPGDGPDDVTVQYCYIHDTMQGNAPFTIIWVNNLLVEYCEIARNYSTSAWHSEAAYVNNSNDYTFRYNRFVDIEGTAVIAVFASGLTGSGINNNAHVYGNIVYCTPQDTMGVGQGLFGATAGGASYPVTNARISNNTIVNCSSGLNWGVHAPYGTGNQVYDNLWVNSVTAVSLGKGTGDFDDYNTLINCTGRPAWFIGTNDEIYPSGDPFVDLSRNDYRLSGPTDPGLPLEAPYDVDMLGHTANDLGNWDRGALQYVTGTGSGGDGSSISDPNSTPRGCACQAVGGHGMVALLLGSVAVVGFRRRLRRRVTKL